MAINTVTTEEGNRVHVSANETGLLMSIFASNISATFKFNAVDARALAERIINTLDNFQLTTIKEKHHAKLRNQN